MESRVEKIEQQMDSILENIRAGFNLRDSINKTDISQPFFYRYATDNQKRMAYEELKLKTKYGVGIKGSSGRNID